MRDQYVSAAETAKLVRVALKQAFPATKFSVRTSTYAGGASVRIRWMDGPNVKRVDAVVGTFNGNGFDGMIDMAYTIDAWVMPTGEIVGTVSSGTESSRGSVPAWGTIKPHDDAERVHFSCSISTERDFSPAFITRLRDAVAQYWGRFDSLPEVVASTYDGSGYLKATPEQDREAQGIAGEWWSTLVYRASQDRESVIPYAQRSTTRAAV